MGHLVALRRGDLAYLHVHPMAHGRPGVIEFHTEFPTAGHYRLFLQFAMQVRSRRWTSKHAWHIPESEDMKVVERAG
jgi:hypothetical protein